MAVKIKLDSAGMLAALNQAGVRKAVTAAANKVADAVGVVHAHDRVVDVEVDEYQTDRPVAGVTLAHAGGIGLEAEYGFLTGAATASGLEIGRGSDASRLISYTTKAGKTRKATQAQVDNWTRGKK